MWYLFLFVSLFVLFLFLVVKDLPFIDIKKIIVDYMVPGGAAVGSFFAFTIICGTPFAGLFWGILGWFIPGWLIKSAEERKREKVRQVVKDFIMSSAGIYAAGLVTPEVVRTVLQKMPEPLSTDFKEMLGKVKLNPNASFPRMFEELAEKYETRDLKAVAAIIEAAERAGGPTAAAKGLKRLGQALRQRDRLLTERTKSMLEVKIAGMFAICILLLGLAVDVTVFRDMYSQGSGKIVIGLSSGLIVGLIIMARKISESKDLA